MNLEPQSPPERPAHRGEQPSGAGGSGAESAPASTIDANVAGALAYLLGIVTGVLFLAVDRERRFVRFHAVQSIVFSLAFLGLWVGVTILGMVLEIIPVVGWITGLGLVAGVGLGGFVAWLFVMLQALQGREWELPGLGPIVRRYAIPGPTDAGAGPVP